MPVSSEKGKNIIKTWLENQTDIKTIVDLGPGSGTYPKLIGINKYIWKAVEIWGPYVKRFDLDRVYQEIRIGDIQYMDLPDGDCAILGDVLEHIEKEGAIRTFEKVDEQFKHVVVSMPVNSTTQYVFEGNEFEKHTSAWSVNEINLLMGEEYKIRKFIDRRDDLPPSAREKEDIVMAIFIK